MLDWSTEMLITNKITSWNARKLENAIDLLSVK